MEIKVDTDVEKIGYKLYCLYCGQEVTPDNHYHDGGIDGTSYECVCEGAQNKQKINELKSLQEKLKNTAQPVLDKLRYREVVREARIKYHQ